MKRKAKKEYEEELTRLMREDPDILSMKEYVKNWKPRYSEFGEREFSLFTINDVILTASLKAIKNINEKKTS